jgi:hypothetical protein
VEDVLQLTFKPKAGGSVKSERSSLRGPQNPCASEDTTMILHHTSICDQQVYSKEDTGTYLAGEDAARVSRSSLVRKKCPR